MYHIFLYFHKGVKFSPGRSRKKSVSLYARLLLFNVAFNSNFSWLQIQFDCSQLHNMCCNMLLHHSTRSQILIYVHVYYAHIDRGALLCISISISISMSTLSFSEQLFSKFIQGIFIAAPSATKAVLSKAHRAGGGN